MKVKNQIQKNQEKRVHFIDQHPRQRKDNESFEIKIQLAEENKTRKSRIQTCETMKHFAKKSGQKIFKTAFMKKIYLFFQKLKTKK